MVLPSMRLLVQFHSHSTQETNGQIVFIKLETNRDAVLAGLLVLLRLFQIDSVLLQIKRSMWCSPLKTWCHVIQVTTDAKVEILDMLGNTLRATVSLVTSASHMSLERAQLNNAPQNALMDLRLENINAKLDPSSKLRDLKLLNHSLLVQDQLKLVSLYMATSLVTNLESILMLLEMLLVAMQSNYLAGV